MKLTVYRPKRDPFTVSVDEFGIVSGFGTLSSYPNRIYSEPISVTYLEQVIEDYRNSVFNQYYVSRSSTRRL